MSTVDIDYDYIDDVSCFLPKSQVEIDETHKAVTMPEWLAEEKELI